MIAQNDDDCKYKLVVANSKKQQSKPACRPKEKKRGGGFKHYSPVIPGRSSPNFIPVYSDLTFVLLELLRLTMTRPKIASLPQHLLLRKLGVEIARREMRGGLLLGR